LPLKPFSTGLPVLATFTAAGLVLATTAVVGRPACMTFAGATGDGLIGAATASAGVVGDVTRGTPGAGTAAAKAAPGAAACASGAAGRLATAASFAEEPDGAVPCTFIDEPVSAEVAAAEVVVSSGED
jgi:hypothetical protein